MIFVDKLTKCSANEGLLTLIRIWQPDSQPFPRVLNAECDKYACNCVSVSVQSMQRISLVDLGSDTFIVKNSIVDNLHNID